MITSVERRKCERLVPQDITFAVFRPDFKKLGPVQDISRSGLGVGYIYPAHEEVFMNGNATAVEIDIFDMNNLFYVPKIPCRLIYDMQSEKVTSHNGVVSKYCGLKFGQLTKDQKEKINHFLENFTIGTA
jgi:hypothetical protein